MAQKTDDLTAVDRQLASIEGIRFMHFVALYIVLKYIVYREIRKIFFTSMGTL